MEKMDRERILAAFNRDRSQMTMQLARELGVPEADVIGSLPDGLSVQLARQKWEELLRSLQSFGKVHVIVSNKGATIEVFGQFGNFSTTGIFFNVQTSSLDMHIRFNELGSIFAVRKQSHMNAVETLSFQFFDLSGDAAFKVFLNFGETASAEKREIFQQLIHSMR